MATILLVPDVFFHRWDQPDGELWLCLRPFVKKADFDQWASDPHSANHSFVLPSSPEGSVLCKPEQELRSINLPTSVDLWMRVIRGPLDPATWLRVARSQGCVTDPRIADDTEEQKDHGAGFKRPGATPKPFAFLFNESVRSQYAQATGPERSQLSEWLELRMESGKPVSGKFGSDFTSLYRNEADPAKSPIPFFRPDGRWATSIANGEVIATNLFWANGLMLPLGVKPVATSIANITSIDLCLADANIALDATEPPAPPRYKFSIPQFAALPAPPYFSQIRDSYAARLVCNLEDPSILGIQWLPSNPTRNSDTDPLAYFSPAFQGYQKNKDSPLQDAWEFISRMGAQSTRELGLGAPVGTQLGRRRLVDLVGLEVRSPAAERQGTSLELTPGLVLTGKVRPYRRFPRIAGKKGSYLATVMAFEPASDGADLLERVEALLGTGDGGLKTLFERAQVPGGWKLQLLSSSQLPWDGPRKVYRVLARCSGETAQDDDVRTCEAQSVVLSLTPAQALKTQAGRLAPEGSLVRWLWRPSPSLTTVDGLRNSWRQTFGAWTDMPVNALFVASGETLKAEIDALYLGDYTFFQANSRTRLEKILGVYTEISDQAPANCVPNADPSQDFEDDLTNFNTASALTKQGAYLDTRVRYAQRSSGSLRGLNRRQAIPFIFEWAHAPGNKKGDDPKNEKLSWDVIREYAKNVMLNPLPIEPFGAQLEHTYCTTVRAVDDQGEPIAFERSAKFDWLLDLPTSAETLDGEATTPGSQAARFIECQYIKGAIQLEFDPRVLDPQLPELRDLNYLDRRALATRAWRSIAEMMVARSLSLALDLRLFDMASTAGPDTGAAAKLARNGFSGHWRDALREVKVQPIPLPTQVHQDLLKWCAALLAAASLPTEKFRLLVPLSVDIGNEAHIARVRLAAERAQDQAPPADMRLVPITQQPTLGPAAENSLWSAWNQIGFRREAKLTDLPKDEVDRLREAFKRWHDSLKSASESITPFVPPTVAAIAPKSAAPRGDMQALVAELPGTDWFTPIGAPTSASPLDAQLVMLPLGFAPVARHPQLGRAAQQVVQRALVHLNDAIDVAYESWARNPSMDWGRVFQGLTSLASPLAQGDWTGPVPSLVRTIIAATLRPQPDANSPDVEPEVATLIRACLDSSSPAGQSPLAVARLLLEAPAIFADAKALLLTRVNFVPSARKDSTPPEGTLARAQFKRIVRPQPKPGVPLADSETAIAQKVVGWKQMVAASASGEANAATRLGFLESLDDARYDNSFTVSADDQKLQAFEDMVDARGFDAAGGEVFGSWDQAPPLVPGNAENQIGVIDREVRLASRAVLEPPELLWSGSSPTLASALNKLTIGQKGWTAARLVRGEGPASGSASAKDGIEVVAFRRVPPQQAWDRPAYADEVLMYFVYRVTGDEEAVRLGRTDAFLNDGFFVEGSRSKGLLPIASSDPPPPLLAAPSETVLRRFAAAGRGTEEAAQLSLEHLLGDLATYGHLQGLIQTENAPDVPQSSVLLRPLNVGESGGAICVGGGAAELRERVRDVCLFRPDTNEPNSTAYLVVGVMLDVWSGWDVTIMQGRNIPFSRWDAVCGADSGRTPPPFDPIFWQAAAQSSRPTTQFVNNVLKNDAAAWGDPQLTFALPAAWYGTKVAAKTVLDQLLFKELLQVGRGSRPSPTILPASSGQLAYDTPFGITIYQEQFVSGQRKPRDVRFPFPTLFCPPGDAANTLIEFPSEYTTFSIDIRWRKPDGSTPLVLERIFAKPQGV